jgi:hypothetical protein
MRWTEVVSAPLSLAGLLGLAIYLALGYLR